MATSTRKLNWTQEELNILVSMVTDRWSVIKGKFTPGLTIPKKKEFLLAGDCR
jgi:hypothetical protein